MADLYPFSIRVGFLEVDAYLHIESCFRKSIRYCGCGIAIFVALGGDVVRTVGCKQES